MDIKSPIKLLPAFKDYLWGGTRLVSEFNKKCDLEKVAESWELSAHKDGSSIITGGELDGMLFSDYIDKFGSEVLGKNAEVFDFFPILIKFIDAKDKLSVQVHPDDEYAMAKDGEYGKTEMWYVLDCDEGASLYYGFNCELTREEFLKRIEENTLLEVLCKVPVKKGDVFFIEAGTVHAIGPGIMICEIQQNSNATYRVYDYDRRDKNGNTRELHIEKAADVSVFAPAKPKTDFADPETLAECKYFKVKKARVEGMREIAVSKACFTSVIVTEGEGELNINGESLTFRKGESLFVPAQDGSLCITGNCEMILSMV